MSDWTAGYVADIGYTYGYYTELCPQRFVLPLTQAGLVCHVPDAFEKAQLMRGIYEGVKVGDMVLARQCFTQVAEALARRHGLNTLILGCTEIPLALSAVPGMPELELVDPAALLARTLAERAYASAYADC